MQGVKITELLHKTSCIDHTTNESLQYAPSTCISMTANLQVCSVQRLNAGT